jgi:iron complex transport system substrate-binding protein
MVHRLSILVALLAMLAACGGAPAAPASTPAAAPAPTSAPAATTASAAEAFPITIEHKYGTTEILQAPTRVVSVGFNDQDAILALGVVPVGIRDWYGEQPVAVWPWAQEELGGAAPQVLPANALNFEQIAALDPDLIIGISSGMTEQEYATLSAIAPTVAQSGEYIDYGVPWQEQTRVIGRALGRSAQAEALVAGVEGLFTDARAQNPAFAGAGAVVAVNYNSAYSAYGPQDVRGRLLTSLGFAIPPEIAELAGESFFTAISNERLDLIDTDVLVIAVSTDAERAVIESDPLFQQLNAAQQGRVVFLDKDLSGAASFSSVLSLPYLLERLVPLLAAARAGDATAPATTAATRMVTDDLGRTVELPANPQRIVALQDLQVLRPLLDLGVTPIASVTHPRAEGAFRFVEEYDVSGVEVIGLLGEPSLERLVQLKPDLIIGTLSAGADEQVETLSAIAPTVVYNAGRPVIEYHRSLAEAVGALDAYDALMADYEVRLAELREGIAPISDELVVSLLAFNPNAGQIEIGEGPYTLIFQGAGIKQPEPQVNFESADEGIRRYWISLEQLPEHDADIILLLYTNDPAVNAPITESPIWKQLKAVQAGQVVEIDGGAWYVQSVRSLFNVIDALEEHLVGATLDTSVVDSDFR